MRKNRDITGMVRHSLEANKQGMTTTSQEGVSLTLGKGNVYSAEQWGHGPRISLKGNITSQKVL